MMFEVRDTGVGIEPTSPPHLRGVHPGQGGAAAGGTGLGLTISRSCGSMGGDLRWRA